jgi:hypothetical protein
MGRPAISRLGLLHDSIAYLIDMFSERKLNSSKKQMIRT